ncbi:hypothetical protein RhiirC2_721905, partial [Rhizophagus irregularis]
LLITLYKPFDTPSIQVHRGHDFYYPPPLMIDQEYPRFFLLFYCPVICLLGFLTPLPQLGFTTVVPESVYLEVLSEFFSRKVSDYFCYYVRVVEGQCPHLDPFMDSIDVYKIKTKVFGKRSGCVYLVYIFIPDVVPDCGGYMGIPEPRRGHIGTIRQNFYETQDL